MPCDALHPVTRDAVVVADPARRVGGRRRFNPRDYQPALDALLDVYRGRPLVVKCAPGIDFDAVRRLGFDGEIEVTSYRGSVREACLWSEALAEPGVRRRATVLDRGEQVTDAEPDDCPVRPAGRWIVDPDGAVVRAGLVRHYGARHGLWQLDPDIAYLSGDRLRPGCVASRSSSSCRSTSDGCVRRWPPWIAAPSRFWSAVSTWTPTRCDDGCGCAADRLCRRLSPASAPAERCSFVVRRDERPGRLAGTAAAPSFEFARTHRRCAL